MNYLDELQKATNKTTTENGGVTNASSLNPCLDFFALGASMRKDPEAAARLFSKAYAKDKTTALRTLFYIRDVREGQGERGVFRACMEELAAFDVETENKVLKFIPEYGRWDDLLYHRSASKAAVEIVKKQLEKDENSDAPSLLAKWMPSENASSKIAANAAKNWAHALGLKPSQYRKLISKLRKKIHLLEQDMSSRQWSNIQYDKIPSQAFRRHTQAFDRNDHERYQKFLKDVLLRKKKVNASTVTTEEVVKDLAREDFSSANAIWKSLDNFVPEKLSAIVMAGVSESMHGRPMRISTSLALYFAERNRGEFANKFLTFSKNPRLVEVYGDTLSEKLQSIERSGWGYNTNIGAAFDALLVAAKNTENKGEIPQVIYIISDMEFDLCVAGSDETAFENARRKWNEAGLTLPAVVFWNVEARSLNLPAAKFDRNVVLISGSNQNAFRFALERKTPEELMDLVVNSKRYKQIRA